MTHINAKPFEIRAMLDSDVFCIVRPLNPQPEPWKDFYEEGGCQVSDWRFSVVHDATEDGKQFFSALQMACQFHEWRIQRLPYAPGEAVVVRETWQDVMSDPPEYVYRADGERPWSCLPWSSSVHMPFRASRLTLTVNEVRVCRVHDLTEEEARLAGVPDVLEGNDGDEDWCRTCRGTSLVQGFGRDYGVIETDCRDCDGRLNIFRNGWNQHHPKTPWNSNPWCVVARCKVHRCNIAEMKEKAA